MTVKIRKAVRDDAPSLAATELLTTPEFATFLLDGLFEGRSVGATLAGIYARDGTDSYQWSWVAEAEGDVIGAIGAYPNALVPPPSDTGEAAERLAYYDPIRLAMRKDAFHIGRLGVLDAFRRQGIAQSLIKAACEHAGQNGETQVTLFVWEDNAPAIALYRSLGFDEVDRVVLPPHPRAMRHGPSIMMGRPL